jgi:hypothetical protein
MSIEIRLFGDLCRRAGEGSRSGTIVYLPAQGIQSIGQVLAYLDINLGQVGNVFLNGRLLPRGMYPLTLGYQSVTERPLDEDEYLAVPVRAGDRVGIFPCNMSPVVV